MRQNPVLFGNGLSNGVKKKKYGTIVNILPNKPMFL